MSLEPNLPDLLHRLLDGIPDPRCASSLQSTNGSRNSYRITRSISLEANEIRYLCDVASRVFLQETTLLRLQAPIQICGTICGHFNDLLHLFDQGGHPPSSSYLFLGGYVNHGAHSLETLCLLLVYKILNPNQLYMLRGSHETELKASIRGLKNECEARSLEDIWPDLLKLFDSLPLAALVSDRIFCCYGGPPAKINDLAEIDNIQRPLTSPYTDHGLAADLLYSKTNRYDPGWIALKRGHLYGNDAIKSYVDKFGIRTICRARQMAMDGYELFSNSAELITLTSVPNYRGQYPNDGAVMQLSDSLTVTFMILESAATNQAISTNTDHYPSHMQRSPDLSSHCDDSPECGSDSIVRSIPNVPEQECS